MNREQIARLGALDENRSGQWVNTSLIEVRQTADLRIRADLAIGAIARMTFLATNVAS